MKKLIAFSLCLVVTIFAIDARSQTLGDRIQDYKDRQRKQNLAHSQNQIRPESRDQTKLYSVISDVSLRDVPAREAFRWWSQATNVPLIIDWDAMQLDAIDPERKITLILKNVPAGRVLSLLASQVSPHQALVMENTPWYIHLMTRRQANQQTTLRVYDVADLVMRIRDFNNAPQLDMDTALSNTVSGGSGSGGGGSGGSNSLFTDSDSADSELTLTKEDRGEMLADLIRESIEPEIWGNEASIRYFQGRLIIKAPRYVHRQIGIPVANTTNNSRYPTLRDTSTKTNSKKFGRTRKISDNNTDSNNHNGPAGVASESQNVSSVASENH